MLTPCVKPVAVGKKIANATQMLVLLSAANHDYDGLLPDQFEKEPPKKDTFATPRTAMTMN